MEIKGLVRVLEHAAALVCRVRDEQVAGRRVEAEPLEERVSLWLWRSSANCSRFALVSVYTPSRTTAIHRPSSCC